MKRLVQILIFVSAVFLVNQMALALEMGAVPPKVELKEKIGGRLDGTPWCSEELPGKIAVVFYVSPDEGDTNNPASEALDKEKFPADIFQAYGIVNMAATWLPEFTINLSLSEKQKRYPRTIYVRDYKKVLVQAWKIADNSSDILVFDKTGKLIFRKDGKLNGEDIRQMIKSITDNL
jgi:uncharacterized protein